MRQLAITSIFLLCLAGAAPAQSESAPAADAFTPAFEQDRDAVRRYYPTRALERGVVGIALFCCRAREDRSLDCSLAAEWPQRHHFGQVGLLLAQTLRLTPDSYAQVQARPQQTFLLPVRWQARPCQTNSTLWRSASTINPQTCAGRTPGPRMREATC